MDHTENKKENCNHPVDDLFRKGLGELKVDPPEPLWNSINRRLLWGELLRLNFSNVPRFAWITAVSVFVVISSLVLFFALSGRNSSNETKINSNTPVKSSGSVSEKVAATTPANHTGSTANVSKIPGTGTVHNYSRTNSNTDYASRSAVTPTAKTDIPGNLNATEPVITSQADPDNKTIESQHFANVQSREPSPGIGVMEGIGEVTVENISTSPASKSADPVIRHVYNPASPQEQIVTARSLTRIPIHFAAGIDAEPDITFYKTNHSYSKGSYSGGVNLQFHFGRFYLRSGAALGYFGDVGQYFSEYKQADTTQVLPVKGFAADSILRSTTAVAEDHYLYLQVPVMLGFKAYESDHLRFSFQAGPVVSFLMDKYEPLPTPEYPNSRVTRLVRQTPDRYTTNWQLWAGFSVEYLFNRNLSVCLEPTYKYGLTPVATEGELPENHSQSVGINIGFRYSFGYNFKEE